MAWVAVDWREEVESKTVFPKAGETTVKIYRRRVVITEYEQVRAYALTNSTAPSTGVTSIYGDEDSTRTTAYHAERNTVTTKTVERKIEVNPGLWKLADSYVPDPVGEEPTPP